MSKIEYVKIDESQVPDGVLFETEPAFQGRFVEVAYGQPGKRTPAAGDEYKRVIDRGVGGGTTYYRRARER